jgi:putative FmdB family regulatory protein
MPIYEFYCPDCHVILNFLSKTVNTTGRPRCPHCKGRKLRREVSAFAMTGKASEDDEAMDDLPIDESKMESAVNALASEAENINEDDPRAAAQLMRKFSSMAGMEFNENMEQALQRMEAGEDPERIEEEMGDMLDGDEDPFILPGRKGGKKRGGKRGARGAPRRDKTLYEM